MSEKFKGDTPPQEHDKTAECFETIRKALENRRLVREKIESIGEEQIKSRIKKVEEMVSTKGFKLSYEELRRFAVFSYFPSSEILPKGWVSERLYSGFSSDLCSDVEVTLVDPNSLIFKNEVGYLDSQLEHVSAYILKEETPRFVESKGWQMNQDGTTRDFYTKYDFRNTEGLAEEHLRKFVHPDAIAVENLVFEE